MSLGTATIAQTDGDTLRIPLIKKTANRGWLVNVVKPESDRTLDSMITGYPKEVIERRYIKVKRTVYEKNLNQLQERDIIILVGMDKSRTKKYIMADIDMDGRLSDEMVYTFDKANRGSYDSWEDLAPIFSFPYVVLDNGQPVQKYATYRIVPWNFLENKDLTKILFDVDLQPVDHYESEASYSDESFRVSDLSIMENPSKTFWLFASDVLPMPSSQMMKKADDIIQYQLKNYKIVSIEKGRIDYLVLAKATANDMDESLKPFHPGNSPEDVTFTTSNGQSPESLYGYRGKYLLLDFWGTWCGPCRKITPDLVQLYQSIDQTQIAMIGVNCEFKSATTDPRDYMDEAGIEWPNTFEIIEKENKGLLTAAKVSNFPTLILIDEKGVVQARVSKPEEVQQLITEIGKKFKKK